MAQWPHNTYGNKNPWEIEIGTRILDRPTDVQNINLVTTVPTNVVVFTGEDATDLDVSTGVDFRFLKRTCYDGSWEVRGFFNQWENFESRVGNLRTPFFTPAILPFGSNPDQFDYLYESNLFSLELNYKKALHPGFTVTMGPRWVSLEEQVNINSNFVNPFIAGFAFDLDTVTQVDNQMPGLGIGMEIRRPVLRQLFFVGAVKGAVLANFISTSTITQGTVLGGNTVSTTIFDDSRTNLAGIGEISARLHYDIAPGNVSCYCGYEAMWLDGVGVAPGQLLAAFSTPVQIDATTTVFIHGLSLGMLIRY